MRWRERKERAGMPEFWGRQVEIEKGNKNGIKFKRKKFFEIIRFI